MSETGARPCSTCCGRACSTSWPPRRSSRRARRTSRRAGRRSTRQVRGAGDQGGCDAYLRAEPRRRDDEFREFLRLAHRAGDPDAPRARASPEDRPVPAEQQEMWLDQILEQRGTELRAALGPDGVVARCGDGRRARWRSYLEHLRNELAARRRAHGLLPAAARPSACARACRTWRRRRSTRRSTKSCERRRAEVDADPRYKGAGVRADRWRPRACASTVAPRSGGERRGAGAGCGSTAPTTSRACARAYEDERACFDGAVRRGDRHARVIFLRAAALTNELNPRSFEDAEDELRASRTRPLAGRVRGRGAPALRGDRHARRRRPRRLGDARRRAPAAPGARRPCFATDAATGPGAMVGPVRAADRRRALVARASAARRPAGRRWRDHVTTSCASASWTRCCPTSGVVDLARPVLSRGLRC